MPAGELFIKKHTGMNPNSAARFTYNSTTHKFVQSNTGDWVDAYLQYGLSFSQNGLSALMTPAPNKAPVENKSRLQHGKSISTTQSHVKKDERDVNVEMHITAITVAQFWQRYDAVCNELFDYGFMEFVNGHCPTKVYRMTYESCQQFTEYVQQMAKFTLRLNEPDPTNRAFTT